MHHRMRRAVAGAGGWTPANSPNTYLWQEAALETGLSIGDSVNTITDQSGNDLDFDATGHAPTWEVRDGSPVYRFAGSAYARAANVTDWKFMHDGTDFYVGIVLYMPDANPDTINTILDETGFNSANIGYTLAHDDRSSVPREDKLITFIAKGIGGQRIIDLLSPDDAAPTQVISLFENDYVVPRSGADMIMSVGGVQVANADSLNTPHSAANSTHIMTIGALASDFSLKLTADIFKILILKNPTEEEKTLARAYMLS